MRIYSSCVSFPIHRSLPITEMQCLGNLSPLFLNATIPKTNTPPPIIPPVTNPRKTVPKCQMALVRLLKQPRDQNQINPTDPASTSDPIPIPTKEPMINAM